MDQLHCSKPKKKKRRRCRPVKSDFWFRKIDAETGLGIAGAVFTLRCGECAVQRSISDSNGVVYFTCVCSGCYELSEIFPPAGYLPNTQTYQVSVDACGCAFIDGVPADQFTVQNVRPEPVRGSFTGIKYDEQTREPLSGAIFELAEGETVIARGTSDSNGFFTFDNLAPGIYTLEEIRPPAGYQPTTRKFTVIVSEDGTVTIEGIESDLFYFSNLPLSYDIELYKRDALTGLALADAVFELSSVSGFTAVASSDLTGLLRFEAVPPGQYTLRELRPPAGYLPDLTSHTVVVHSDGSILIDGQPAETFILGNTPFTGLQVHKVNEAQEGLAGAQFQLTQNGSPVASEVTDVNGFAAFPSLAPGTYTLTETVPPVGYQPDATVHTVQVFPDGSITIDGTVTDLLTVINLPILFDVAFTKTDAETSLPLANASFELSNTGGVVGNATSDSNGRVNFGNLTPGTYILRETAPPEGYLPIADTFTVVISADGAVTINGVPAEQFTLPNQRLTGFQVFKVSETGTALADAEFQLSQNGIPVRTVTTDATGHGTFNALPPGQYTLTETAAPPGYRPDPTVHTVLVQEDGTILIDGVPQVLLTVTNQQMTYTVQLLKTDADTGAPLAGGVFELLSGSQIIQTVTSGSNGLASFGGLTPGTYTLREAESPAGYRPPGWEATLVVSLDGTITIDGQPVTGSFPVLNEPAFPVFFTLNKRDESGNPLPNATFTFDESGGEHTATTDSNGQIIFQIDRPGTYTLLELVPPPGYQPYLGTHIINVDAQGVIRVDGVLQSEITIINSPITTMAEFVKFDLATGQAVPGAEFELAGNNGLLFYAVSDFSGRVNFGIVPPGSYILREVVPAPGYEHNTATYTVLVDPFGKVTIDGEPAENFILFNQRIPSFQLRKINENGTGIPGVEFDLYNESTGQHTTLVTDSEGYVSVILEYGTYQLTEIAPPPGYLPYTQVHRIEVQPGGLVVIDGVATSELTIQNQPIAYDVLFQKADLGGQPVGNAAFELLQNGMQIAVAYSDFYGRVNFGAIAPGQYILRELYPPPGYLPITQEFTVDVFEDGTVLIDGIPADTFMIRNIGAPPIELFKYTEDGRPLGDAEFQLRRDDGSILDIVITDFNGYAIFNEVQPGNYLVIETRAPIGYLPTPHIYHIVVAEDGTVTIDGVETNVIIATDLLVRLDLAVNKIWNDLDDRFNIRPPFIDFVLYRDGLEIDRVQVPSEIGRHVFTDLPQYAPDGHKYVYTIDEDPVPYGYIKTLLEDNVIVNTVETVTITVDSIDQDNGSLLARRLYQAALGSDFTVYALTISGYTLVSPPDYTFYNIAGDEYFVFYYTRSIDT